MSDPHETAGAVPAAEPSTPSQEGRRAPRKVDPTDAIAQVDLDRAKAWLRDDLKLPALLKVSEVAEVLGYHPNSIYLWIQDGRLSAGYAGEAKSKDSRRRWRVNRDLSLAPFIVKSGLLPPAQAAKGGAA